MSAHAGLSYRFCWAVPRRDSPPGALAAAGFSALFFNHNRLGQQPDVKSLVTSETDLTSLTGLTWELCVPKPGSRAACRAVPLLGALAAAGSLSFPEQFLWRQPDKKSLMTNDTDLARLTRLTWEL